MKYLIIIAAIVFYSLYYRLLSNTNKKTTPLTVPSDPRIRKSFESCVDDIEGDGTGIYRSNSCFELSDNVVARVSVEGQETTCYYKSIYVSSQLLYSLLLLIVSMCTK